MTNAVEVDEGKLSEFIAERNKVIHGTYDASAEGAWKTVTGWPGTD